MGKIIVPLMYLDLRTFFIKKDDQNPYILVILLYKFTCVYSAAGINITFPSCELSTWWKITCSIFCSF